ncbi:MAG: ABC transporter ATP-binding protein [Calditrichia bacterium]
MAIIETHELTKYYTRGQVRALEDFSLTVEKGQIFSLLGPNGSGKTTLIKLLLGIIFPTRGTASVLGKNIRDYQSHTHLGYLAENHRFPEFLHAEHILYYYGKMAGVEKETLNARIPQLLQLVKLEKWGKTKIRKYSKGMMQRLGIAQALINDPQLLFLDEPTDGIDPVGRREIRDLLRTLREQGKTIFLNSHLLSEVERISDEVAILKNGKLLQKGNVQDFISIKDQYQLKLQAPRETVTATCDRLRVLLNEQNGYYRVAVNDIQQLNNLIDELRQRQAVIEAVIPYKISLEDFFIEVIEDKKAGTA